MPASSHQQVTPKSSWQDPIPTHETSVPLDQLVSLWLESRIWILGFGPSFKSRGSFKITRYPMQSHSSHQQMALAVQTSKSHFQYQYQNYAHGEHQSVPVIQLYCPHFRSRLGSLKASFQAIQQPSPTPNPAAAIKLIFPLQLPSCPAPQHLWQLSVMWLQLQEFQCD